MEKIGRQNYLWWLVSTYMVPHSKDILAPTEWARSAKEGRVAVLRGKGAVGSLVVRASNSNRKAWVRGPMPPNTLRVHTEYALVLSVRPKVLWAESRMQGDWRLFPSPSVPCLNYVVIYRPFGKFHRAILSSLSCSRSRPATCILLVPCHNEFRGPRSDYVRQVVLATTHKRQRPEKCHNSKIV
ncbi:uncharacterized protein TNCV_2567811 [Trichonephila clavipes]|uniref:Uncharacterized protein n=1 Tax=Trichonephila clavipes TaxID=2585209 RepID=A0A8X6WKR3_TRICX|nr:uncharacterized protein TNCV_2567811 [Trichonephila clavipes]